MAEKQLTNHDVPPRKRKDGVECPEQGSENVRGNFCWGEGGDMLENDVPACNCGLALTVGRNMGFGPYR